MTHQNKDTKITTESKKIQKDVVQKLVTNVSKAHKHSNKGKRMQKYATKTYRVKTKHGNMNIFHKKTIKQTTKRLQKMTQQNNYT